MPVGRQLILMRDVQHARLVEVIADDLQADRHFAGTKAAWNRHAGQAGEVYRDRIDVGQVHLHRIVAFFTKLEGG